MPPLTAAIRQVAGRLLMILAKADDQQGDKK
jgi:hypothetical protein